MILGKLLEQSLVTDHDGLKHRKSARQVGGQTNLYLKVNAVCNIFAEHLLERKNRWMALRG